MSQDKNTTLDTCPNLERRGLLTHGLTGLVAAAGMGLIGMGQANAAKETIGYSVSLRNAHTGEVYNGVYRVGGYYVPKAFRAINYVMRDHYNNDLHPIDPRLIDLVARLQKQCNCNTPVSILSGYRSQATNSMLRRKSGNVARNSYHIKGQAADIRIAGTTPNTVHDMAKDMRVGGVGYYPRAGFVHVDTGDVRSWVA
jgi:uncharacterized protein YcbK (DUF882 family)